MKVRILIHWTDRYLYVYVILRREMSIHYWQDKAISKHFSSRLHFNSFSHHLVIGWFLLRFSIYLSTVPRLFPMLPTRPENVFNILAPLFSANTVDPFLTDTTTVRKRPNSWKLHLCSTYTSVIRALMPVSLVSLLERFDTIH